MQTRDPAEAAPRPRTHTASLYQKRAEFRKRQEAEKQKQAEEKAAEAARKKAEDEKKKKAAAEAEKKRIEQAKADQAAKVADEVANLINNEESRGATTGQGGQQTLGKETGRSATLSQTEMGALVAAMRKCYNPPLGAAEEGAKARLLVRLNPDGTVSGQPQILSSTGPTQAQTNASAAVRAVLRCGQQGEYAFLDPSKYDQWREIDVTFDPSQLF